MVVSSRPHHFLDDLEQGSLIRVPVSFGHIVGSGKAKRYSTGSVKVKFIGWHETISNYVLIEYEGFSMTVHVGQVWRDLDEIAG